MQSMIDHRLFSPVRPWKIKEPAQSSLTISAMAALSDLNNREAELRRANRQRLGWGLVVIVAVAATSLLPVAWWMSVATRLPPQIIGGPDTQTVLIHRSPAELASTVLLTDSVLAVLMLPVAVMVKKPSRADVANQILKNGCNAQDANPILRLVIALVACGMLWGEFLIIDAVKTAWVVSRLSRVDRFRAAMILTKLRTEPIGLDPRRLLLFRECPVDLRRLIAYLVINEWADIAPRGDLLAEVSPARRRLRH
jgi:hypothetical protein